MRPILFLAAAATLISCSSGSEDGKSDSFTSRDAAAFCDQGVYPPTKLLLHPVDGIANEYIVVLMKNEPLDEVAAAIAAKYSGTVTDVFRSTLWGFGLKVADAQAAAIASEPAVCFIEQNGIVRGGDVPTGSP